MCSVRIRLEKQVYKAGDSLENLTAFLFFLKIMIETVISVTLLYYWLCSQVFYWLESSWKIGQHYGSIACTASLCHFAGMHSHWHSHTTGSLQVIRKPFSILEGVGVPRSWVPLGTRASCQMSGLSTICPYPHQGSPFRNRCPNAGRTMYSSLLIQRAHSWATNREACAWLCFSRTMGSVIHSVTHSPLSIG